MIATNAYDNRWPGGGRQHKEAAKRFLRRAGRQPSVSLSLVRCFATQEYINNTKPRFDWKQILRDFVALEGEVFLKVDPRPTIDLVRVILARHIEGAAADAHNFGWKRAKDEALTSQTNPFLGWGPRRIRVRDLDEAGRAEVLRLKPQADLSNLGADVYHPLYKPYEGMLGDQPDGGTRLAGQNAIPLMVLVHYLADFRGAEIRTVADLERVITGLLNGTDRAGIGIVAKLNHIAFQAAQLVIGERGIPHRVMEMAPTGQVAELQARDDFKPFDDLGRDVQALDTYTLAPAAQWLLRVIRGEETLPD